MPALPPVQNVVQAQLNGTIGNGKWSNTIYLQYTGTAPQVADLNTIATGITTAWNTNIAPLVPTTAALATINLADLTAPTASTLRGASAVAAGTRAGTQMPNSAALVVSELCNLRYRGGHPRNYLPAGVIADVTTGSQWTTAFKTAALSGMRAYRTALNALTHGSTTYKWVAVSYSTAHAHRPTPLILTVNDVAIHGRVDTQRGRLGKETP